MVYGSRNEYSLGIDVCLHVFVLLPDFYAALQYNQFFMAQKNINFIYLIMQGSLLLRLETKSGI